MPTNAFNPASPKSIWQYYVRVQTALGTLRNQWPADATSAPNPLEAFIGMNRQEFERSLLELRGELDSQVTLVLVASFEAMIRVDFNDRVTGRLKDQVSVEFQRLFKKYGLLVPLEEILDIFKVELGIRSYVGRFKQLVLRRHWLAHGRYWVDKSGVRPDPQDAWLVSEALLSRVPTNGGSVWHELL